MEHNKEVLAMIESFNSEGKCITEFSKELEEELSKSKEKHHE